MTARYDRDDVIARVDLAALADRLLGPRHPRTRSWTCPNPGHHQTGRTPPVTVFTDRHGSQRWHCHGCGDGGTAIDLTLRTGHADDFRHALEWLATDAHVDPTPDHHEPRRPAPSPPARLDTARTRDALARYAAGCYDHLRTAAGADVRRWLTQTRAIPEHVLDHTGVGADPGPGRLGRPAGIPRVSPAAVFPIRDDNGDVVFTLSRAIRPTGNAPRWINTASSIAPNPRLAIYRPPQQTGHGPIIVTEGVLDALSVVTTGHQAAAILGTGLVNDDVLDRLAQLRGPLLIATDNDPAGRHLRDKLLDRLHEQGARASTLQVPSRFNDVNEWHTHSTNWRSAFAACLGIDRARLGGSLREAAGLAGPG